MNFKTTLLRSVYENVSFFLVRLEEFRQRFWWVNNMLTNKVQRTIHRIKVIHLPGL